MMKKTILVVDDDLLMLKIICSMLSKTEFEILQAANGNDALKLLDNQKQDIHLIITDYNMPDINGLELATTVKLHEKHRNTPLILITANSEITSILGEHRKIFNEVIQKPFSSELILNKVAALLAK